MKELNYEIVNLKERILVCLEPTRLLNSDPEIFRKMGDIWMNFSENFNEIKGNVIDKPICTYSNYEADEKGEYDCSIGCEILKDTKIFKNWVRKIISFGKYAKFVIDNKTESIKEFWKNIWNMDLARKFGCDFEEHQDDDPLNGKIFIFISIIE